MGITNVEIKARCENHESIRQYLEQHGADFRGVDHQIDIYFRVPNGRLKLREGNIENALIHYQREDQAGPKKSEVTLYNFPPNPALKETLTKALGVLVVVDKRREIAFIDNVKFHLDRVESLGDFMEIEAIDKDGTIGQGRLMEQCQGYLDAFGVQEQDLLERSYSDMLLDLGSTRTA